MEHARLTKCTTANERFHASGGVCPQTVLCEFGSLSPARAFVEPPPAQSRMGVICKQCTARAESENKRKNMLIEKMLINFQVFSRKNMKKLYLCSR